MKIAIIGIRGIPVTYSGFEVLAERLSRELALRGHKATVYCRKKYIKKREHKGVRLISLPSIESKNLSTLTHTAISTIHSILEDYDLILYLGVGNSLFSIIPRLFGKKTVVHIDGLDWKREKWSTIASLFLRFSEYLTLYFPSKVITDSKFMKAYYRKKYGKNISFIPYGYSTYKNLSNKTILAKYKLMRKRYITWMGRIVPENHVEEFIQAALNDQDLKYVIIGDDLYDTDYKNSIFQKKNENLITTGFIAHKNALSLIKNSAAYIETKRSGGTHPSLIDAMGTGVPIISNDFPANKETLGNSALYYSSKKPSSTLPKKIKEIEKSKKFGKKSKKRAELYFNWEKVIDDYEKLFLNLKSPNLLLKS